MSSQALRNAVVLFALIATLNTGCANKTRTGALVGTGVGTGLGAIVGHQIGKGKEGAMIGAAVGAASGALLGHKEDVQDQEQAHNEHVANMQAEHQAQLRAMSNYDVMDMAQKQISDPLIISTIQDRGGAFDTSPTGIINLRQAGVSETVIMAMQRHNRTR